MALDGRNRNVSLYFFGITKLTFFVIGITELVHATSITIEFDESTSAKLLFANRIETFLYGYSAFLLRQHLNSVWNVQQSLNNCLANKRILNMTRGFIFWNNRICSVGATRLALLLLVVQKLYTVLFRRVSGVVTFQKMEGKKQGQIKIETLIFFNPTQFKDYIKVLTSVMQSEPYVVTPWKPMSGIGIAIEFCAEFSKWTFWKCEFRYPPPPPPPIGYKKWCRRISTDGYFPYH